MSKTKNPRAHLIKFDVRLDIDLYANGEEDARNLLREIRDAAFKIRGVDGVSTFIRNPRFEEVV